MSSGKPTGRRIPASNPSGGTADIFGRRGGSHPAAYAEDPIFLSFKSLNDPSTAATVGQKAFSFTHAAFMIEQPELELFSARSTGIGKRRGVPSQNPRTQMMKKDPLVNLSFSHPAGVGKRRRVSIRALDAIPKDELETPLGRLVMSVSDSGAVDTKVISNRSKMVRVRQARLPLVPDMDFLVPTISIM
jgi:hypothetical protein